MLVWEGGAQAYQTDSNCVSVDIMELSYVVDSSRQEDREDQR